MREIFPLNAFIFTLGDIHSFIPQPLWAYDLEPSTGMGINMGQWTVKVEAEVGRQVPVTVMGH